MPATQKTRPTNTSRFGRSVAIGLLAAAYGGGLLGADAASAHSGAQPAPAMAYAKCMRAHGIKDFPYPKQGKLELRIKPGSEIDPHNPRFRAAQKACQRYLPRNVHTVTGDGGGGPRTNGSGGGGPVTTTG